MDVEILARIQFAFTIAFHYIYPPLSIGIGIDNGDYGRFVFKNRKQRI